MSDGQSPAPKRLKDEGVLSASGSGGATSSSPGAREGGDVSGEGSPKAKKSFVDMLYDWPTPPAREGGAPAAREGGDVSREGGLKARVKGDSSFFDKLCQTSSDEESHGASGEAESSTLKGEFYDDVDSDSLGIGGSPGPRRAAPGGDRQSDEEGGQQPDPTQDFGDEFAVILAFDPPLPTSPTPLARELLDLTRNAAGSVRQWLLTSATEKASCDCQSPLPRWDKAQPKKASTCGRHQASIIAAIDMQEVLERQKQRGGKDEVPYILARTVRSCLQYNASIDLGCRGAGNQCVRGPCFKRAMDMFAGEGMEGIPKEVVLALLQDQG